MNTRAALAAALLVGSVAGWQPATAQQQSCADGASSLPSERFRDNGDGTVTDQKFLLVWMKCASGQAWRNERCTGTANAYGWADAKQQAANASRDNAAVLDDWRVPSLRELATITDRACRNPRTNLAVFPSTPAAAFWSSSARSGNSADDRVLALSFGAEGVLLAHKDERLHLRLVRTGP